MAAEAEPHRGEHLVGELRAIARSEARVERSAQHVRRHAFFDRGLQRPAAFAGIRDAAGEMLELSGRSRARRP